MHPYAVRPALRWHASGPRASVKLPGPEQLSRETESDRLLALDIWRPLIERGDPYFHQGFMHASHVPVETAAVEMKQDAVLQGAS